MMYQRRSVLRGCWGLVKEERRQVVSDHVLLKVHMVAGSMVEPHPAALVKSAKANPVLLVHLLFLERDVVPFAVPGAEPLRGVRVHDTVLVPHPEPEILHRGQTSFITGILDIELVVDLGKEDRVSVEAVEVPPGTVVLRRCTKVLHPEELSHIAQEMVDDRAEPLIALCVDTDSVVG